MKEEIRKEVRMTVAEERKKRIIVFRMVEEVDDTGEEVKKMLHDMWIDKRFVKVERLRNYRIRWWKSQYSTIFS